MQPVLTLFIALLLSPLALAEDVPQQDPPIWIDQTMEDMVMPLKQWLEYKEPESPSAPEQKLSLRQAIALAIKQYPGMVLSAKEEADHYQIKILSKKGVVKVIQITSPLEQEGHENSDH